METPKQDMIEYWLDAEQTALAALVYARNQLLKLRIESSEPEQRNSDEV